jgi:ligand-binding sensor domain-containing protein
MHHLSHYRWLFIILLLHSSHAFTQSKEHFVHYTNQDGLTSNAVTSITQDKWGYMWISTLGGLNRYDGKHFIQYYSSLTSNSLPDDDVTELVKLGDDLLGASTSMGLHLIDTKKGTTRNIIIPPGELKYAFKVNTIMAVLSGENENIFILTRSGFYHFNGKDEMVYRFDYYKGSDAETKAFGFGGNMLQMSADRLLLYTIDGLYKYDIRKRLCNKLIKEDDKQFAEFVDSPKDLAIRQIQPGRFIILKSNSDSIYYIDLKKNIKTVSTVFIRPLITEFSWRTKLCFVNDSLMYLTCREKGYYKISLDPVTNKILLFPEKMFPDYSCLQVFFDRDKRIWVATTAGIFKESQNKNIVQVFNTGSIDNNRNKANIQQIYVWKDRVYTGSRAGGLLILDKKTLSPLQTIYFKRPDSLRAGVFSIAHLNEDTLSITTNGPVHYLKTTTGAFGEINLDGWDRKHNWGATQFRDRGGNLWLTTNSDDKLYAYDPIEHYFIRKSFNDSIHDKILTVANIYEDREGNLWMTGHGLFRYNTKNQKIDLVIDSFPSLKFPRKAVDVLAIDKMNNIWLSNHNNGLLAYNINKKTFRQFSREDGLPNNIVIALKIIDEKLWIATPSGIACLDLLTNKIAAYGRDDGFPAATVTSKVFSFDATERWLYAAYEENIVRFRPDSLQLLNRGPEFFIEYITLGGDSTLYHPREIVKSSHGNNDISVSVSSINYEDYDNQRFAYRLGNEEDTTWKFFNQQSEINFNNLSPGRYILNVKMFPANNRWPEQIKELSIVILPPFWQTWWFGVALAIAFGLLVFGFINQRIKNIRKKASIDKQLAEFELKALHAQMNPHFIFNALNSIKDMVLNEDKKNASKYLSRFAQLIRLNLEHSKKAFITLEENIEYLNHYLKMEQLRFPDLIFEIDADPNINRYEVFLPPMLIQPLVENAIWHGLLLQPGEKKLQIRFLQKGNSLLCEIEDNGIGIRTALGHKSQGSDMHHSLGIKNINQRINVLNEKYRMRYQLIIKDKADISTSENSGTIAVLKLPLHETLSEP